MRSSTELFRKLNRMQSEMIAFTRQLVRVRSDKDTTEISKLIIAKLAQHHIKARGVGPNVEALVRGRKHNKTMLFCGHMDTVSASTDGWTEGPFSGSMSDGKIWGRGSADMKGGLTSLIFAAIALKDSGLTGDVKLLLTSGEEIGLRGMDYALKHGLEADAGWVAEPGANVIIGSRGVARFKLTTKGVAGHSGRKHDKNENAISNMGKLIQQLDRLKMTWKKDSFFPAPSVSVTMITGGVAENVVPNSCSAIVDCRLSKGQTADTVLRDIANQVTVDYQVERLHYAPPFFVNQNSELVHIFSRNSEEVLGRSAIRVASPTSDANLLTINGIPSILFGPEGENLHGVNEWVDVKSILEVAKVGALSAVDLIGTT